ncbi:glutathione-dependent formaldehyde dehydrogenase [Bacillus sp. HMF5848]|uniref:alcohol dehydrogenase catalytic domain-containing protein n=1 Tax=Bacillus sp. HMF5848 TaxID=2495421 RepID=UPI000F7730A8|nr:alcohol dehydrogenase catalytic domain-containing protein [Bacillus sp. HMF5848]RSK26032.1 glutathione-dependent formaldehyde dehydrogenase [Bacillus sp. HMF5848]
MKAVTYQGIKKIKVKHVEDPSIKKTDDIIISVSKSSICGSDLHLYHGLIPSMSKDYVIGHEAIGKVEDVGRDVTSVRKGDKVIIPYHVACGVCAYCQQGLGSLCDEANNEGEAGGYFGCSRLYGDYQGSQAELLRVPFANFTPFRIPEQNELTDDELLLLTDAVPTAYWGVHHGGVKPGDTVVVLGCGPIGLLVQKFAWLKGATRVIAVDCVPYRLEHAKRTNKVEVLPWGHDVGDLIKETTSGGADVVIDCVGMSGKMTAMELVETALRLQGGTMSAIETATQAVKKAGTIMLIGIYGTRYNAFPLGDIFTRNVSLRTGYNPAIHLIPQLYAMLTHTDIKITDIISHRLQLDKAAQAYEIFNDKEENCLKIILQP